MTEAPDALAVFLTLWAAGFGFSIGLHVIVWCLSAFKAMDWLG